MQVLILKPNTFVPATSESRLYNQTLSNGEPVDDLHFGTAGLTPAFAWVTLDDDGTDTDDEVIFGVGSAVTSEVYNMNVVHDTSTDGTRIYAQLSGIYKVTGNYIFEGNNVETTLDIKVDGTTKHTIVPRVHSSVDPVERTHIYVGQVDSGSYISATADGASLNYDVGSVLMAERLK